MVTDELWQIVRPSMPTPRPYRLGRFGRGGGLPPGGGRVLAGVLARRRTLYGGGLGADRWVAERAKSRLHQNRRLKFRVRLTSHTFMPLS